MNNWGSKTQIASGKIFQRNFKAINQPVVTQIKSILESPMMNTLELRTKTKRSSFRVLGEPEDSVVRIFLMFFSSLIRMTKLIQKFLMIQIFTNKC
jgi:hypothetical protein